ncbi:MAG TPA: LacI family DNA-binding transcriptional regulator, partial [Pseudonocardia sp.]|nr:LacI family DNA-binding transcriptional regulator [Pseudonocardia sp.]
MTLQTIADRAGVSRMTVSNAFSRPDRLSPAVRERVLAIAEELGYAGPDPAARTLSTGRSRTVGVLFTDQLTYAFADPVATTFLSGVASVLEPA